MSKPTKTIDNFQISRVIGTGTFGKVRQGIHIPTQQKVAIKILQKKKIKSNKDIQRIRKQLEILKQLNHPNILKLLDVKQTEKQIFIITELAKGEELYDRIVNKGSLGIEEAKKYFVQLYEAVKYLQSKNVAHRDVKPENIIVDGENLKLIDFGLSTKWNSSKTAMETPCGSPCYAAPEMVLGKKYDCRKVDIWAMGITLYAILMGRLPFQHQNTQKLYKMIQNSQYDQIKGIPSYLSILIRAMIQKDPKKRITINQISQNIWIKDQIKQNFRIKTLKSQFNQQILKQIQTQYNLSSKSIIQQISSNQLSQISTFYHLKYQKLQKTKKYQHQDEIHYGPFHLQFVFKNTQVLQTYLNKHQIEFYWVNNQKEKNTQVQAQVQDVQTTVSINNFSSNSNFGGKNKKFIFVNGQILTVKKLKNLPKMIYLPLKKQCFKQLESFNNSLVSCNIRQRSQTNLEMNSTKGGLNNFMIQTF